MSRNQRSRSAKCAISLKQQLERDVYQSTLRQLEQQREKSIALESRLRAFEGDKTEDLRLAAEIRAQYPEAKEVTVAREVTASPDVKARMVIVLEASRRFATDKRTQLERWLKVRVTDQETRLVVIEPQASSRKR
jgi:hypothetical protein